MTVREVRSSIKVREKEERQYLHTTNNVTKEKKNIPTIRCIHVSVTCNDREPAPGLPVIMSSSSSYDATE